jgi:hypothetical protein
MVESFWENISLYTCLQHKNKECGGGEEVIGLRV